MMLEFDHFLAACLRGEKPAFPTGWKDEQSHDFAARIQYHGVALALCHSDPLPADWPSGLRDAVLREARQQALWEEMHHRVLVRIFEGFAAAGVEALVMKGTALAYSLYQLPAMRRRGDTDIMIREKDLSAVRSVLLDTDLYPAATPYGLLGQEIWYHGNGYGQRHVIDLHWQANESVALQLAMPTDMHFASPVAVPRLAPGALMPPLALTFMHLVINKAWHGLHGYTVEGEIITGGERLITALDLSLLMRCFTPAEWDSLSRLARASGLGVLVADALRFARDNLAAPVSAGLIESLASEPADTPALRWLRSTNRRAQLRLDLAATPGLGGRVAMLGRLAFPPATQIRQSHPALADWPLPLSWLAWFGGRLGRLARGWVR